MAGVEIQIFAALSLDGVIIHHNIVLMVHATLETGEMEDVPMVCAAQNMDGVELRPHTAHHETCTEINRENKKKPMQQHACETTVKKAKERN